MDWITQEYVKAEAKKGRKQAIECTQLHWQQLWKADQQEIECAMDRDVDMSADYCAMCIRYFEKDNRNKHGKCYNCLLNCWKNHEIVIENYDNWEFHPNCTNWQEWKQAAKAMLAKIDRLHERLYGSKP